jgi:hypothetical protein
VNRKQIETYLENERYFRDYSFVDAKRWGRVNTARTINLLKPDQRDLDDALDTFVRDGYGTILIYLDKPGPKKTKREKTVFSMRQLAHVWSTQSQGYGRNANDSMFFEGDSIYSYGTHYKIARIYKLKGETVVAINNTGYSNTTDKHTSAVWGATTHLKQLYVSNPDNFEGSLEVAANKIADEYANFFSSLKPWKDAVTYFLDKVTEHNALALRLGCSESLIALDAQSIGLMKEHVAARNYANNESPEAKARFEKKKQAEAMYAAERKLKAQEALVEFHKGGAISHYLYEIEPQQIRVKGNVVQTTGGAEVPLNEALLALPAVESGRAKGLKIGEFEVGEVKGDLVTVGCHTISLSAARKALINKAVPKFELIRGAK